MLIRKAISLSEVQLKTEDGETGSFSGYASVFGGVDSYGDTIKKGAFKATLKAAMPKMFFNHKSYDMPVGKWLSAKEDDHGLLLSGELTPGLGIATDLRAALKHGTLDGLSIGGYLSKGDYQDTDEGRVITKWSRLMEVSLVTFPADDAARVDGSSIKSELAEAIDEIESVRDLERFLRDAGSFSKGAAVALVARAKAILSIEGDPDGESAEAKAQAELESRIARLIDLSAKR